MDFETTNSYSLLIEVNDGANIVSATATVTIVDVNEAPTITSLPASATVAENVDLSQLIHQVTYNDPDASGNTFSFTLATNPTPAPFSIDSSSK